MNGNLDLRYRITFSPLMQPEPQRGRQFALWRPGRSPKACHSERSEESPAFFDDLEIPRKLGMTEGLRVLP